MSTVESSAGQNLVSGENQECYQVLSPRENLNIFVTKKQEPLLHQVLSPRENLNIF